MLLRMPVGLAADWSGRVTWETKYRHSSISRSLRRQTVDEAHMPRFGGAWRRASNAVRLANPKSQGVGQLVCFQKLVSQ